jgi:hypothetical protein
MFSFLYLVTTGGKSWIHGYDLRQCNNPPKDKVQTTGQERSKAKSMIIIFFDIKGTAQNEFILAGQTLNSIYY